MLFKSGDCAVPADRHQTRVLAVSNQKGGVGKTTTAINLGTALAAIGQRCLIVDMDPQGNASTGLGVGRESRIVTIYDVVVDGRSIDDAAVKTAVPGLDIVPAGTILQEDGEDDAGKAGAGAEVRPGARVRRME